MCPFRLNPGPDTIRAYAPALKATVQAAPVQEFLHHNSPYEAISLRFGGMVVCVMGSLTVKQVIGIAVVTVMLSLFLFNG